MLTEKYRQAISEVLAILDKTEKKYVEMIPTSFLDFLEKNAATSYKTVYDPSKSLSDTSIKPETAGIISIIYLNYWSTPEEKIEFQKILHDNQLKYNEIIKQTYNTNSPFLEKVEKKLNTEIKSENNAKVSAQLTLENDKLPVNPKKNYFSVIINKIKRYFKHKA